jgi:hypothetical protein
MSELKNRTDLVAFLEARLNAEDCPAKLRGMHAEVLISQLTRAESLRPYEKIQALKKLRELVGEVATKDVLDLLGALAPPPGMHEAGTRLHFGV